MLRSWACEGFSAECEGPLVGRLLLGRWGLQDVVLLGVGRTMIRSGACGGSPLGGNSAAVVGNCVAHASVPALQRDDDCRHCLASFFFTHDHNLCTPQDNVPDSSTRPQPTPSHTVNIFQTTNIRCCLTRNFNRISNKQMALATNAYNKCRIANDCCWNVIRLVKLGSYCALC